MIEKHYTIKELCGVLNMSFTRARLLVMDEPGVIKLSAERKGKAAPRRTKLMYRIPESVVERILRRSANPAVR